MLSDAIKNKVNLIKEKDNTTDEAYVINANGRAIFTDDEYRAIQSIRSTNAILDAKLFSSESDFLLGANPMALLKIDLRGDYNDDANRVSLNVTGADPRTIFKSNLDKELNILNVTPIVDIKSNLTVENITYYATSQSNSSIWKDPAQAHTFSTISGSFTKDLWGREERRVSFVEYNALVGSNGWVQLGSIKPDGTYTIMRDWTYGFSSPVISFPGQFQSTDAMFVIDSVLNAFFFDSTLDYTLNNELYIYDSLNGIYVDCVFLFQLSTSYYFVKKSYFGVTSVQYTRGRLQQDVITYFVENITPGTSNVIVDNQTYAYLDANEELANSAYQSLKDTVLEGGVQKAEPATVCNLTFNDILNDLWEFSKITYKLVQNPLNIEQYYFRLIHFTEKPSVAGTGANDLTNYKGESWTYRKNHFTPNVDENYYIKKRNGINGGLDFVGNFIEIPEFEESYPVTREVDTNKIYRDINDIAQNGSKYNGDSDNQAVLLSCDIISPDNTIRNYADVQNFESVIYDPANLTLSLINASGGTNLAIARSSSFTLDNTGDKVRVVVTTASGGSQEQLNAYTMYVYNVGTGIATAAGVIGNFPFDVTLTTLPLGTYTIDIRTNYENASTVNITHYAIVTNDTINDYQVRTKTGALTGSLVPNVELSSANMDAGHGKYGFPYKNVKINGTIESLASTRLLKQKLFTYSCPIDEIDEIDEDFLINCDGGAMAHSKTILNLGFAPTIVEGYKL